MSGKASKYTAAINKLLAGHTIRIHGDPSVLAGLRSQYYRERDKLLKAGYPNNKQFTITYEDSTESYLVKLVPVKGIEFAVEVSGEEAQTTTNV